MAYQVLARKWRPHDFDSVVGQKPIVKALQNALREDRIAQAYLFSGIRGVGKTSVARILAKALNCERGAENGPCNECALCTEVDGGGSLDVLEIDAATHSKVEQVRELTENLKYKPVGGRYKVVVLDEVHRLSRQAFDALLKIVEEPPEHLVFIFATTELESVPATILSRCQEFNFQRVPHGELVAHLKKLADAESIEVGDKALRLISRAGEGSVRDAVALLDQLATYGSGKIADDEAARILGGVDAALHHRLLTAIVEGQSSEVVAIVSEIEAHGWDPRHVFGEFLSYCRDALHLSLGADTSHIEMPDEEAAALAELAQDAGYENLLRLLNQLLGSEEAVRRSESGSLALEIAWLRAAELPKLKDLASLLGGTPAAAATPDTKPPASEAPKKQPSATAADESAPAETAHKSVPEPIARIEPEPSSAVEPEPEPSVASENQVPPRGDSEPPFEEAYPELADAASPDEGAASAPRPEEREEEKAEEGAEENSGDEVPTPAPAGTVEAFRQLIGQKRQVMGAHLGELENLSYEAEELLLTTAPGDSWLELAMRRDGNRETFEECLAETFGANATWRIAVGNGDASTEEAKPSVEDQKAEVEVLAHPTVQAALDIFGGTAETIGDN